MWVIFVKHFRNVKNEANNYKLEYNQGVGDTSEDSVDYIAQDIFQYLSKGWTNFTDSAEDQFILPFDPNEGGLGKTDHAFVWKGMHCFVDI